MSKTLSEDAVKRLILASAPERHDEFEGLWKKYSPQIEFTEDKHGFSLEAGAFGLILFNHKSMSQIWLLGFVAQKALHAYSPFLFLSQLTKLPIASDDFINGTNSKQLVNDVQQILNSALELNKLPSIEQFHWPNIVPEPSKGKPSDIDGSMVFDLLCMGGAYCFLHEIKHVMFKEEVVEIDSHEEEMKCDAFARDFLLAKIDMYSNESGYNINLLKTKRAMSLALASLLLLVLTPNKQWFGTESHPSIIERIVALTDYLELPENDYFWVYFSCIILSIMEKYGIQFNFPHINSQKEFCMFLLKKINDRI